MAVEPMANPSGPSFPREDTRTAPGMGDSWALDRHVLPRIALAFISVASLSGVYLTMTTHGASPGMAVLRWVHLMSLGVLAGGTMWWGFFIRKPEDPEERDDVARFLLEQQARFQRMGRAALALSLLSSVHLVTMAGWAQGAGAEVWLHGGAAVLLLTLGGAAALLFRPPAPRAVYSFASVRAVCGGIVLSLTLTAALDARLTFPGSGAALVLRPLHLVAFGLWVGGAVWNIFIAVPAAQRTLSIPMVITGARALERFRWVVRVILPTLVLTGLVQALPYTGFPPVGLTGSLFGQLILFKLALLVGLVVIFITCPLWRACSPIRGMCDLEDLRKPTSPEPALRLDNRGKACAGFVHVRRALDALQPGAVLEVLSTDSFSWWELPAWLEVNGYSLLEREKGWWRLRRSYRFLVEKVNSAPAAGNLARVGVQDRES